MHTKTPPTRKETKAGLEGRATEAVVALFYDTVRQDCATYIEARPGLRVCAYWRNRKLHSDHNGWSLAHIKHLYWSDGTTSYPDNHDSRKVSECIVVFDDGRTARLPLDHIALWTTCSPSPLTEAPGRPRCHGPVLTVTLSPSNTPCP